MNCSSGSIYPVYLRRDNRHTLDLLNRGYSGEAVPFDLSSVHTMTLDVEGQPRIQVARDDANPPIDWWHADLSTGQCRLHLGVWASLRGLKPGTYGAALTSYDGAQVVRWTEIGDGGLVLDVR